MRKLLNICLISIVVLLIQGCSISKSYMYEPTITKSKNTDIKISLVPINPSMRAGFSAFRLKVNNIGNDDIEIDWNKTYFIERGRTAGTFMFEGIVYKDRNNQKPSDIVFSKNQFSKIIYPNNYVVLNRGTYSSWGHRGFGTGTFGIYLTLKNNNKEIKEKVFVEIKESIRK